jgi:hypothetical protein
MLEKEKPWSPYGPEHQRVLGFQTKPVPLYNRYEFMTPLYNRYEFMTDAALSATTSEHVWKRGHLKFFFFVKI